MNETSDENTPLYWFINNIPKMKQLLDLGADINGQNHLGDTALLHACKIIPSSKEVIEFLLQEGADPNIQDNYGDVAIKYCLTDPVKVQLLLEAGADPNFRRTNGDTLLHEAISQRVPSFQIVQLLLEAGANVNARNQTLRTPLMEACMSLRGNDIVLLLLSAGADPNIPDEEGNAPIMYSWRNLRLLETLIEAGVDVNQFNSSGLNLLHLTTDLPDILSFLIGEGADVNLTSRNSGATPLIMATRDNQVESMRILLEAGADTEIVDARGNTAINYTYPNMNKLKLLVEAGADVNHRMPRYGSNLEMAIEANDVEGVRYLLESGADPYQVGLYGFIPLDIAQNEEIIILLLTFMPILPSHHEREYADLHRIIHETQEGAIDYLGSAYPEMYERNLRGSVLGFLRR
jgi:uncharacterized protein